MLGQLVLISIAMHERDDSWSLMRWRNRWISEIISDSSDGIEDVMLMMTGLGSTDESVFPFKISSIHPMYCDRL